MLFLVVELFFLLQCSSAFNLRPAGGTRPPCHHATPRPHPRHTTATPASDSRRLLPGGRRDGPLFSPADRGEEHSVSQGTAEVLFSASVEPQIWFATSAARCFRKPRGSSGWVGCSTKMQTTVEKNRPSPNQPCLRSQQPSHQPALFCGLAAHSRHPHREGSILGPGQVAANQFV